MTSPASPAGPGPRGVAEAFLDYLRVELPGSGVAVRTFRRGTPRPLDVDSYPALYVQARGTEVRAGSDPDRYSAAYAVRVYGFVRAGDRDNPTPTDEDGYDHALNLRDELLLTVRELLLIRTTLGGRLGRGLRPGLRESLSDLDVDDVGRTLGAFYIEVTADSEETVRRTAPQLGRLDELVVAATGDAAAIRPRDEPAPPPVHPAFL